VCDRDREREAAGVADCVRRLQSRSPEASFLARELENKAAKEEVNDVRGFRLPRPALDDAGDLPHVHPADQGLSLRQRIETAQQQAQAGRDAIGPFER
jgi:hypothetical protein